MRHDTSTAPSAAMNSTRPLSARIDALERELHVLYPRQPGQMEAGEDWGRWACSGGTSLFPTNGEDTCHACLAGLAADRAGTSR